jgi:PIN domain nuclease of toxin-antitoxin system
VRILFDSHSLVWFLLGDRRLPPHLRDAIELSDSEVFISAVCVWEIASKVGRGKWPEASNIPALVEDLVAANTFLPLSITLDHARAAGFLSGRHRDPFDRMLAVQSQLERIPLATADPIFRQFGVEVMW